MASRYQIFRRALRSSLRCFSGKNDGRVANGWDLFFLSVLEANRISSCGWSALSSAVRWVLWNHGYFFALFEPCTSGFLVSQKMRQNSHNGLATLQGCVQHASVACFFYSNFVKPNLVQGKAYDGIPAGVIEKVWHCSLQGKDSRGWEPSSQMEGGWSPTFAILVSSHTHLSWRN